MTRPFYDLTKRNGEYIDRSFFYRTLMAKLRDFRGLTYFNTVEKRRAIAHRVMADGVYLGFRRGQIAFVVANDAVTDAVGGMWS